MDHLEPTSKKSRPVSNSLISLPTFSLSHGAWQLFWIPLFFSNEDGDTQCDTTFPRSPLAFYLHPLKKTCQSFSFIKITLKITTFYDTWNDGTAWQLEIKLKSIWVVPLKCWRRNIQVLFEQFIGLYL